MPRDAFGDIGSGSAVSFSASLSDGLALPEWLSFDPVTGTFHGDPPPGFTGTMTILVTVRDAAGHQATTTFHLSVGQGNAKLDLPGDHGDVGATLPLHHAPQGGHAELAPPEQNAAATYDLAARLSGKPALTAQLHAAGSHRFLSERQALIESAGRHAAG